MDQRSHQLPPTPLTEPDKQLSRMSGSMGGCGNGVMVRLLRHRQTKGAVTDRPNLRPPRHILTLPKAAIRLRSNRTLSVRSDADYHRISIAIDSPFCFFSSSFGALKVSESKSIYCPTTLLSHKGASKSTAFYQVLVVRPAHPTSG